MLRSKVFQSEHGHTSWLYTVKATFKHLIFRTCSVDLFSKPNKVQKYCFHTFKWDSEQYQNPADRLCSRAHLDGLCGCVPWDSLCEQISFHTCCKQKASSPCGHRVGGLSSSHYGQSAFHTVNNQKVAPLYVCGCAPSAQREWGSSFRRIDRGAAGHLRGAKDVGAGERDR